MYQLSHTETEQHDSREAGHSQAASLARKYSDRRNIEIECAAKSGAGGELFNTRAYAASSAVGP